MLQDKVINRLIKTEIWYLLQCLIF